MNEWGRAWRVNESYIAQTSYYIRYATAINNVFYTVQCRYNATNFLERLKKDTP